MAPEPTWVMVVEVGQVMPVVSVPVAVKEPSWLRALAVMGVRTPVWALPVVPWL